MRILWGGGGGYCKKAVFQKHLVSETFDQDLEPSEPFNCER